MARKVWQDEEYLLFRRRSLRYLRRGLIFSGICAGIYLLAQNYQFVGYEFVSSSAIIAGWVALWRPIETFLYDLPDLREDKKRGRRWL